MSSATTRTGADGISVTPSAWETERGNAGGTSVVSTAGADDNELAPVVSGETGSVDAVVGETVDDVSSAAGSSDPQATATNANAAANDSRASWRRIGEKLTSPLLLGNPNGYIAQVSDELAELRDHLNSPRGVLWATPGR
jgi:hypothetical protein